jgi:uncharacterized cupin superfamily protein
MNRVDRTYLGDSRTKIEIVSLPTGESTDFHFHGGHEFVWIDDGNVEVEFEDRFAEKLRVGLTKGDSVAFSSLIKHKFINVGDKEARLVAARPARSRPIDEDPLDWFFKLSS